MRRLRIFSVPLLHVNELTQHSLLVLEIHTVNNARTSPSKLPLTEWSRLGQLVTAGDNG